MIQFAWAWELSLVLQAGFVFFLLRGYRWAYGTPEWRQGWGCFLGAAAVVIVRRVLLLWGPGWGISVATLTALETWVPVVNSGLLLLGAWRLSIVVSQKLEPILFPSARVSIDSQSVIIAWDAGAERMFGWTAAEVLGHTLMQTLLPPEAWEHHLSRMAQILAGDLPSFDACVAGLARRKDGQVMPVEIIVTVTQDAAGARLFHGVVRRLVAL